jgi:hypothetical protein
MRSPPQQFQNAHPRHSNFISKLIFRPDLFSPKLKKTSFLVLVLHSCGAKDGEKQQKREKLKQKQKQKTKTENGISVEQSLSTI